MIRFRYSELTKSYSAKLKGDHVGSLVMKIDSGASESAIGLGCVISPDRTFKDEQEQLEAEQKILDYYISRGNDVEYVSVASGKKVAAVPLHIKNTYIDGTYVGNLRVILLLSIDSKSVLLGNDFIHFCKISKNYEEDFIIYDVNLTKYSNLYGSSSTASVNIVEEIEGILSEEEKSAPL